MALQTSVLSPATATPMVMAESALYRQRLEVIAEKRRLQEEIGAARRELEEEKLRVERLKRKSLRERWLMDGAAEGPERPEDLASKDPQSPEGQAQARIRNLEDSLFSLQSQLQLLQSASTGAQHRPAGRPTWRREGPRPLSQPSMEAGSASLTEVDKRTSLPAGPVGLSPESPSDPREALTEVLPALRPSPEGIGASSEANGPCPEQLSLGAVSVTKAKGDGVVEVVWAGLRATENSATDPTGVELEAKVEEVVLGAIGARQGTSSPELPTWVKEGKAVVEVVWEGLGGSDPDVTGESAKNAEATQVSSLRLQEQFEAEVSRKEEGTSRDSPEGVGQGGPGGEEGSFIWVERAALSEDWEELLMEGLEAPPGAGCVGAQPNGSEGSWEAEKREMAKSEAMEDRGTAEKLRIERGGVAEVPEPAQGREESQAEKVRRDSSEGSFLAEVADEEKQEVKVKDDEESPEVGKGGEEEPATTEKPSVAQTEPEGPLEPKRNGSEKPLDQEGDGGSSLDRESKTSEELLEGETGGEGSLDGETTGSEKPLDEKPGGEGSLDGETTGSEKPLDEEPGGEGSLDGETKGSEKPLDEEPGGSEPLSEEEKTPGAKGKESPQEQGKANEAAEFPVEDASQPGTPLRVQEEPASQGQELQGPEKQEGSIEKPAREPQPCAESEGPPGDATPLLAETPGLEQPVEGQPLLHQEVSSTNPGDHPAPTYAPARQLELAEAKEASGPKQKTCQCCVVM
ncbi:paralemmin-3 [Phodopus roborovskii]|uniref:Palm3 protein n=1 Tax=Phodopus roborovskii TaxID=109678 RepID=A0AAU9ZQ33_PHORO|nr:paralemmin-3 [Phodopus roborovskii]CAH6812724.1 Palm3 [Phodopus roborovskii]